MAGFSAVRQRLSPPAHALTGPQAKGAINPDIGGAKALVYAAGVLGPLGYDTPNVGGYFRAIHMTAEPGSFANPLAPTPSSAGPAPAWA